MINRAKNEISKIMDIDIKDINNLKRFEKGMSNYTYYFEVNDTSYVVRLIGEGASKYVDYYNELNVILQLVTNDLTGELVYFDPITGTKISKYINGSMMDFTKNEDRIVELIKTLKNLHNIKNTFLKGYDLINRLEKYESFLDNNLLDKNYLELKTWWINKYNELYINEEQVFCHNDLQDANIIVSDSKVRLIDFEYAAYNDVYYDFATFESNAYLIYEMYYNKPIDLKAKHHIDFYKIYQSLQWHLVASYKHEIGFSEKTNYDFLALKNYFINNALKISKEIINEGF